MRERERERERENIDEAQRGDIAVNRNRPSMRIQLTRKRNTPPPLSSPLPPHSDSPPLYHLRSPQSHLLQPTDSPDQTPAKDRQPSDPTVVAVSGTDGVGFSSDEMNNGTRCRRSGSNQDSSLSHGEEEVDAEEKLTVVVTNPRLGYSYDAETSAGSGGSSPCPSPSHGGHWCEEDKLFPLKKRRASFTSKVRARMAADREQKESVREPTRNTEKTWVKHYDDPENEEEQEKNEANKKQSGEGGGKIQVANSRCSRTSGRGWRCNRPAILGHVRCEYHLNRARYAQNRNRRTRHKNNISLYSEEEEEDNGKGFDKRGVVKARSISCLLGQTARI